MTTTDEELGIDVPVHPAAAIFALLEDEEFEQLKQNIATHGLREPVVMFDGELLDGRNRWRACRQLGIEPLVRHWEPTSEVDSPEAFVLSQNVVRRHIGKSQRAAYAARLYAQYANRDTPQVSDPGGSSGLFSDAVRIPVNEETPTSGVRQLVASAVGISPPYVSDAYNLMHADTVRFDAVEKGRLSLTAAFDQHCAEHHRNGTLLTESTLREGLKRMWLKRHEAAKRRKGDADKPSPKSVRARSATVKDVPVSLSPQQIGALLRKERQRSGVTRSFVPATINITFANDEVREEYQRALLKDQRIVRVEVITHLEDPGRVVHVDGDLVSIDGESNDQDDS